MFSEYISARFAMADLREQEKLLNKVFGVRVVWQMNLPCGSGGTPHEPFTERISNIGVKDIIGRTGMLEVLSPFDVSTHYVRTLVTLYHEAVHKRFWDIVDTGDYASYQIMIFICDRIVQMNDIFVLDRG